MRRRVFDSPPSAGLHCTCSRMGSGAPVTQPSKTAVADLSVTAHASAKYRENWVGEGEKTHQSDLNFGTCPRRRRRWRFWPRWRRVGVWDPGSVHRQGLWNRRQSLRRTAWNGRRCSAIGTSCRRPASGRPTRCHNTTRGAADSCGRPSPAPLGGRWVGAAARRLAAPRCGRRWWRTCRTTSAPCWSTAPWNPGRRSRRCGTWWCWPTRCAAPPTRQVW